ncbi:MAG TPA: histidine--tRNA ligase [Gammaproteobacteria bacterium]|nr:histidine--tRNA ligase [Gammaproteobacteria bacterium]
MAERIQPVRGMNDILPDESHVWQYVEDTIRAVLENHGYREIRVPVVESTELFARSIGAATDIVSKEMYTFEDRNGASLSLRPEATAGCVRAALTHGLTYNQTQRLWYAGPMFRHERPQKGRYRQFYQIGAEAYGFEGPDIDAELIAMSARMWARLGIRHARLQLNSLGTSEARAAYRHVLVEYFGDHRDQLDAEAQRRLEINPLRLLDSKDPALAPLIAAAPSLQDHLDAESRAHFEALCRLLDEIGIAYDINPRLVRGLDYYSRTVFEWVTDRLGAQDAICSGGRYDALVEQLGGRPTPAIGWALGVERLIALLAEEGVETPPRAPDVYLVRVGEAAERAGFRLAAQLRDAVPDLALILNCGGGSFKSQLKKADRSGAGFALILGDDEVANESATLKPLRTDEAQRPVAWAALADELKRLRSNDS